MEIERLGPYQIVGKLGRGGMGTVYKAVHSETGETAAVKLLSAALAQEADFRSRFEAEIETLRKLNHPNIVRLFGFGEQHGQLFYAMELVVGNSLEEELQRGRRFEWREVTRIGIETCHALRHAHDRGVIHRDIKPGNLLLAADGRVKLSDFGIARLFGNTRLTSLGSVLGTAEYMAPEQAEGRPVDGRADLYSLGALMYVLLARRPVFRGKSLPDMLHKQRFEQPDPLRKHDPDAPEELERILGQLLEKDPARRIPNADILARRLEAMSHALSLGSSTVEADPSWFLSDTPPGLPEAAASADDLPATRVLDSAMADLPAMPAPPPATVDQPPAEGISPAFSQASAETVRPPLPPGRFVTVSEDELGDADEEETRPPAFSWQTGALVVALLAVGFTVWWFLQPPTADVLYDRIAAKTADESIASILQAEDEIRDFLSRYSGDHRARRLREYQNEIELYRLERKFELRVNRLPGAESLEPIERAYLEAINYLRLDPGLGMAKLQAIVDLYAQPGRPLAPSEQCLILAQRRLAALREDMKKHAGEQLTLLEDRLSAADALRQSDPKRANAMYRAIIELYAQEPWATEAVRRARAALPPEPPRRQ
jgi:serine/threonine-protein kinase